MNENEFFDRQAAPAQAERGWTDEEAMKHRARQLADSMDAMAFNYEQRAKIIREGANAVRHKAGLPEHT